MKSLPQFHMILWYAGTALIVASWFDLVSPSVGWVGFCVSGVGVLLGLFQRKMAAATPPVAPKASLLCGTCLLHQSNDCRRPERPFAVDCPEYLRA